MTGKESKQRQAFEEINRVAQEELGDSLKKLVLYGSVAREEETSESDLDIFSVVETREQKTWLEKEAAETGVDHSVLVSAIVKTEEEYEKMRDSSFAEEVMETGEVQGS